MLAHFGPHAGRTLGQEAAAEGRGEGQRQSQIKLHQGYMTALS